ncbi:MAG: Uma2 family endonuclease [Gemmataceae bacterium]
MSLTMSFWVEGGTVRVPDWVNDLASFRRWANHPDFPDQGHIAYLCGEVWIDMSGEQLYTHGEVKSEVNTVLRALVKAEKSGRYWHEGVLVTNAEADISNKPDGLFVYSSAFAEARVREVAGQAHGFVELEGSPDMVMEIVSDSSVQKDTVTLRAAYAAAGVAEYWLIDARGDEVRFDLLTLAAGGYWPARVHAGWAFSPAFRRWFRLTRAEGDDGRPAFTLESLAERP